MLRSFVPGKSDGTEQRPGKIQKTNQTIDISRLKVELLTSEELALCDAIKKNDHQQATKLLNGPNKPSYQKISKFFDGVLFAYLYKDLELLNCILTAYVAEIPSEQKIRLIIDYYHLHWNDGLFSVFTSYAGPPPNLAYSNLLGVVQSVAKCYSLFEQANIHYSQTPQVYALIMKSLTHEQRLSVTESFVTLHNAEIDYSNNVWIYEELVKSFTARLLTEWIIRLDKTYPYNGNEILYKVLFKSPASCNAPTSLINFVQAKLPSQVKNEILGNIANTHTYSFYVIESYLALLNEGISYNENEGIYKLISHRPTQPILVLNALLSLIRNNVVYYGNEDIYQFVAKVDNFVSPETRASDVLVLLKNNILYQGNEDLYQLIFNGKGIFTDRAVCFLELINSHIPYWGNEGLYQLIAKRYSGASELLKCFRTLMDNNIPYQGNEYIYKAISKTNNVKNATACYLQIIGKNISFNGKGIIFDNIEAQEIDNLFALLKKCGIHQPKYITLNILVQNHLLAQFALDKLVAFGLNYRLHAFALEPILQQLNSSICNYSIVGRLIKKLENYFQYNTLISKAGTKRDKQIVSLKEIVDLSHSDINKLTYGPLNKSNGTLLVESILNEIVTADKQHLELISFNHFEQYIISLPNNEKYNLSILLRNANLSQLYLETNVVEKIGEIVTHFLPEEKVDNKNAIVELLPLPQQIALSIYVSEKYKNVNRLFRSEKLSESKRRKLQDNPAIERMLSFLLGCLINDAINKLNHLVDHLLEEKILLNLIAADAKIWISELVDNLDGFNALIESYNPEKAINSNKKPLLSQTQFDYLNGCDKKCLLALYNIKHPLVRGEQLSEYDKKARLANPYRYPALTSFSAFKEGISNFLDDENTKTSLENAPYYYVINDEENEVLIAHGEQIMTTEGPNNSLISTIVRSPSLVSTHYLSELALLHAFEFHLSNPYEEENCSIVIDNIEVFRPNHNATHTYRVMLSIECVARYFSHFASDLKFAEFCKSITNYQLELLRVAAAFSITGRESEINARDDLTKYDRYREASATHLKGFLDQHNNLTDAEKNMLWHIVRYMGNPEYETKFNTSTDEHEKLIYNFCHRILSLAHKLDLPRCYDSVDFQLALKSCYDLSAKSQEQQEALNDLIHYMIELIKEHGGMLACDINPNGTFIDVHDDEYKSNFAKVSTSINQLFTVSQSITIPSIDASVSEKLSPTEVTKIHIRRG